MNGNVLDSGGREDGIIMKVGGAKEKIADYLKRDGFGAT